MIRRAIGADVPALVELAGREHARSRFAGQRYDPACATASFSHAVTGLATAVFVHEQGGRINGLIAGLVQPSLFSKLWTAYEVLWYAEDGSGLRLLRALSGWAKSMRAVELVVHDYAGISDPQRFARAVGRQGFAPLGASYVLKLEG